MGDETRPQSGPDRRFGLVIGVGIGTGIVLGKGLEKLLAPGLGEWGAFGVSLLAAAAAAFLVSLLVAHRLGGGTGGHD